MSVSNHLHQPVKVIDGLELHYVGDVAVIVMDRGENRLSTPLVDAYMKLMDEVESNPSCKGLITTGKGKFYSNGLDLKWMATLPEAKDLTEFMIKLNAWLMRILLFPLPTLAALNGHAYAGGALLAEFHDMRTMNKDKGWLCFNEVFISRQFARYQNTLMRSKQGQAYSDAIALGKRYTASEALSSGLVHAASPQSLLLTESVQLLKSLYGKSGYPRESMHLMKADVYRDAVEQYKTDFALDSEGNLSLPVLKPKL